MCVYMYIYPRIFDIFLRTFVLQRQVSFEFAYYLSNALLVKKINICKDIITFNYWTRLKKNFFSQEKYEFFHISCHRRYLL